MNIELKKIRKALAATSDKAVIGTMLRDARDEILSCRASDPAWEQLNYISTDIVDAVILRLYEIECAKVEIGPHSLHTDDLAIVATGGYGRRELSPYSDIDVTFIPLREDDGRLNAVIKGMFQSVMDVFLYGAGMKVGYAYRLLSDLGQLDHQTQTALLDARLVAGSVEIFDRFEVSFRSQLLVADFLFQKNAERFAVLEKSSAKDNPFVIEPNVKEGSGGLRDMQMVEWLGQVLCNTGRDDALDSLQQRGIITVEQSHELTRLYSFLRSVRNALHCESREARDILTTEKQEAVGKNLGYEDSDDSPAVETFMADYYRSASKLKEASRMVMRRCVDSKLNLGVGGLSSVVRKIVFTDSAAAELDDALPLHACELAQAYQLQFGDKFDEDIAAYIVANPVPKRFELCGRVFGRILSAKRGVAQSLRWLADRGVLEWIIPEFAGLRYLIPYDASHDYTVGEHSLRVVDFLDELRTTDDPKFAEYKRVWQEIETPEALVLAGLIHDIGKQWPQDGPHAEVGAKMAEVICHRLAWPEDTTRKVVFLTRNHLLMAETSRLRDLRLDETIRDFTKIVDEHPLLHMLLLLTCADTHQVGEGVWTEMKSKFLFELFSRSEAALASAAADANDPDYHDGVQFVPDLAKHRERIRRQLSHHNLPLDAIHEHTARMSAQYLLNTPLEEMYLHMAMINRLRTISMPIVDFKTEFGSDYTELTIVTYDDPSPGLLAKIFGVLYALDVNLHASQVFTRDSSVRIALDTLWVDFRGKPLSSAKKAEVQDTIRSILTGKERLSDLCERRKKPDKEQVIHGAKIDDITSERYSLLEIRAPMEPGVLFRLTRAISDLRWNIHSARLSMWGSRVRAAFYVTDRDGMKLAASEVSKLTAVLPREEVPGRRKSLSA